LETTTLINLIQNSTVPHLIKSSINFLQTELDQFFQREGTKTFDIIISKNSKSSNHTKPAKETKSKSSISGKIEPSFHVDYPTPSAITQSQLSTQNSLAKDKFYEFSPYVSTPAWLKAGIAYL
jgi:hypothetical protein